MMNCVPLNCEPEYSLSLSGCFLSGIHSNEKSNKCPLVGKMRRFPQGGNLSRNWKEKKRLKCFSKTIPLESIRLESGSNEEVTFSLGIKFPSHKFCTSS